MSFWRRLFGLEKPPTRALHDMDVELEEQRNEERRLDALRRQLDVLDEVARALTPKEKHHP